MRRASRSSPAGAGRDARRPSAPPRRGSPPAGDGRAGRRTSPAGRAAPAPRTAGSTRPRRRRTPTTWARAPSRPLRRHRWTTAIGTSTAGQSLAENASPSSAPLTMGRSRTSAASAVIASSVGQRSKRVSKSEPRTRGEMPTTSSAAHVRASAGADRAQGRGCGEDAAGAAEPHEHRERRRVAPAHVLRQEHGRQCDRRILEREVAVRHGSAAHEPRRNGDRAARPTAGPARAR